LYYYIRKFDIFRIRLDVQ